MCPSPISITLLTMMFTLNHICTRAWIIGDFPVGYMVHINDVLLEENGIFNFTRQDIAFLL